MQLRGTNIVVDTVASKKPVISGSGATRTLNELESGSLVLMDRAAGIVFTLPAAKAGLQFDFVASTSVTTNAYKIITAAGTELLIGGLITIDTDSTNAISDFSANGSTHVAINMTAANSNALGGLVGTRVHLRCLNSTQWLVEGVNLAAGTPATPFATS